MFGWQELETAWSPAYPAISMSIAGLRGWLAAQCDISSRKSKMQTISHCYQQGDADVLCQWFPRAPETAQLSKSKEQKLRLKKKKPPQKSPS